MCIDLARLVLQRPLILDGAMGTMIEAQGIDHPCKEETSLSRPGVIAQIHRAYLDAGADVITTCTFGASRISLADHGLAEMAARINRAAATIAREAADLASTPSRRKFVAGDIGPTSKLPTLGQVTFADLFDAYDEQASALIEGGVDFILIETCQDLLQTKAAIAASRQAMERTGRHLPLVVSITVEKTGTMLLGTDILAALAAIAPYRPLAFGINCATGPDAMEEHIRQLSKTSPLPIICQPNAGMPENVGGKPLYPLGPDEFSAIIARFVREYNVRLAGGCCGTTPGHIAALVKELKKTRGRKKTEGRMDERTNGRKRFRPLVPSSPRPLVPSSLAFVSSLYTAIPLEQEPRPFIIAEQTNVNGSKRFRELLLAGNFDAMAEMGREVGRSSHALDICVAYAGRDERSDIKELVRLLVPKTEAALVIDSTNPHVLEAALAMIPGRSIINSINLEDGGKRARLILSIARRFGAAVVGLTIDERGMAKGVREKLEIAKRITDLVLSEGFSVDDIIIDPLTFTLASGDSSLCDAGQQTLDAIELIHHEIPGSKTILGVSNISYGLPSAARKSLTSVFLHMALKRGLDAAIINPTKIVPIDDISAEEFEFCKRLIENDRSKGDPLAAIMERFKTTPPAPKLAGAKKVSPKERLKELVIGGMKPPVTAAVDLLLKSTGPSDIINKILMPAMEEVGKRFGEGKMALPFVLASAEVVRVAIDHLAPLLGTAGHAHKGTIVLATVRGDVHDIGKNLVDTILSSNGFRVINLGIRQPAQAIIEAARSQDINAIGLSGLLVSSTEVMREDMEIFRSSGFSIPILCGGAALTKTFVKNSLAPTYGGKVYYCADAFAALAAMEEIVKKSA